MARLSSNSFGVPYDTIDGVPQFHSPTDYPDKWEIFKAYNKRDVEAELEIDRKLSRFPVPDFIWQEFYLDQEINDRGILVDMQLADKAINLDAKAKEELTAEVQKLTGVENPNSVYQLLDWLETQGYKSDSLGKTQVLELIKTAKEPVKSVLQMRLQLSKSSVKKYTAMKNTACSDNRARRDVQLLWGIKNGALGWQKCAIAESSAESFAGFIRSKENL